MKNEERPTDASSHALALGRVALAVTEIGGHLDEICFEMEDGRAVRPMHSAPWRGEAFDDDTSPMLRQLTGDFFCAPFGPGDLPGHASPVHGKTANGHWTLRERRGDALTLTLDDTVMGAAVTKTVMLRQNESVIYQRHVFTGGEGALPLGHHAMLSARSPLTLAFGPRLWAGSPPEPTEIAPEGRCLLEADQTFNDLHAVPLVRGGTVDVTRYPFAEDHDDIWMVVADPSPEFGWTAATCEAEGWLWFSLKDPRRLPQTVVWMSNGGRSYAPWNDRHRHAIGLEDVCGYFHLGHAASVAAGCVPGTSAPTVARLAPSQPLVVSYMFGLAKAPHGFGAVTEIRRAPGGVALRNDVRAEVFVACDPDFLKTTKKRDERWNDTF